MKKIFTSIVQKISQLVKEKGAKKKRLFAVILLLLVSSALFFYLNTGETQSATILSTAPITRGNIERTLHATGLIKPEEGAEVKTGSRFTGVIEKLHVRLGDKVKKGQLIAELDSREQQEEYARLSAVLEGLNVGLRLHEESYPRRIAEANSELKITKSNAKYTQQNYDIFNKLHPEKATTIMNVNRTVHELRSAKEMVLLKKSLKERLEKEYILIREQLTQNIKEIEAEKNSAAIQLSYSRILSPIDGTVSGITAQEGETVVAGLQVVDLITVLDVERLELRVYVNENDIGEVAVGQEVHFKVEAYPKRSFSGKVALIHPSPELRNNIVYYRALVHLSPETSLTLRPEMTARCDIVVSAKEDVLLMPSAAFKWIGQQRLVFKVDASGNPVPIKISIGLEGNTHLEIQTGLQEGDVVVTEMTLPEDIPSAWKDESYDSNK